MFEICDENEVNEVSRASNVVIHVAHMSLKERDNVLRTLYDLSAKYEYDTYIGVNLVTKKVTTESPRKS